MVYATNYALRCVAVCAAERPSHRCSEAATRPVSKSPARRLQSPEVRRVQAEMLRAAASGIRKKTQAHEQAKVEEIIATPQVAYVAEDRRVLPTRPGDVDASGRPVKPVAPAGDGKRSPRVFTLSQLGR